MIADAAATTVEESRWSWQMTKAAAAATDRKEAVQAQKQLHRRRQGRQEKRRWQSSGCHLLQAVHDPPKIATRGRENADHVREKVAVTKGCLPETLEKQM